MLSLHLFELHIPHLHHAITLIISAQWLCQIAHDESQIKTNPWTFGSIIPLGEPKRSSSSGHPGLFVYISQDYMWSWGWRLMICRVDHEMSQEMTTKCHALVWRCVHKTQNLWWWCMIIVNLTESRITRETDLLVYPWCVVLIAWVEIVGHTWMGATIPWVGIVDCKMETWAKHVLLCFSVLYYVTNYLRLLLPWLLTMMDCISDLWAEINFFLP